jgi:hypothetical protein
LLATYRPFARATCVEANLVTAIDHQRAEELNGHGIDPVIDPAAHRIDHFERKAEHMLVESVGCHGKVKPALIYLN